MPVRFPLLSRAPVYGRLASSPPPPPPADAEHGDVVFELRDRAGLAGLGAREAARARSRATSTASSSVAGEAPAPRSRNSSFARAAAGALSAALRTGQRLNAYFRTGGEHDNPFPVLHTAAVPETFGLAPELFAALGTDSAAALAFDPRIPSATLATRLRVLGDGMALAALLQRAEQEYILQNMSKAAIHAAVGIANLHGIGIAVRGTDLRAHPGFESGLPTKAQEFKSKTAKEVDVWLCPELDWADVGAAVHYDPRVEWSSRRAPSRLLARPPTPRDFERKLHWVKTERLAQLLAARGAPIEMPSDDELRKAFFARAAEFRTEDEAYRGELAPHVVFDGPRLRLRARPHDNMVGDHDIFAFTNPLRMIVSAVIGVKVQRDLQASPAFQAQHGPIAYWQPSTAFNEEIKRAIMGRHDPDGAEPLILVLPGNRVTAAFYVADAAGGRGHLMPVRDPAASRGWLLSTYSGQLVLQAIATTAAASQAAARGQAGEAAQARDDEKSDP